MADNVQLDPGSTGAIIATDEIGTTHYQIIKLAYGALETANLVTTAAGLPTDPVNSTSRDNGTIDIAMGQGAHDAAGSAFDPVSIGGFSSAAAPTGVSADGDIVKAWFLANGAQAVNLTAAGALLPGNATDGLLVNLGTNNDVTVTSGTVALGAGTAGIGKLTANTGVDIGDVDILSVIPGTGATNLGKAVDSVVGATDSGVAALVRRRDAATAITPANADYTHLNVNNLGKLWVTGTHLEDAAHATGDVGMQALAVSAATPTATAGNAGDYQPLSVSSVDGRLFVNSILGVNTLGGSTLFSNVSSGSYVGTLTQVKSGASQIYWLHCMNLSAAVVYLQVFNLASASVALGTTVPGLQFPIATQGDTNGAGFVLAIPNGIALGVGFSFAITTTKTGATAATADTVFLNGGYA